MKIGIDDDKKLTEPEGSEAVDGLADLIRENQTEKKTKFSSLSGRDKARYIWDYYKWWFIGTVIVSILLVTFIRDYRENSKPVYLYAEMLNTYLGYDRSNTLYDDFVREEGIDLTKERLTIGTEETLSVDNFDTTMIAFQQRLVANYAAAELDVVIGPKAIMEGPANCDCYADFDSIIPEDLKEELSDSDYEFYYFDPSKDDVADYEGEDLSPYCAGVYLDNCSYLNNLGENGAYPVAETEDDRIIFTIAANSKRTDHATEFLRFLIHNH